MTRLRSETRPDYRLADFASGSSAMRGLLELARKVAAADSSLLILGETGVGKEWLARAIHAEGRRASAPFIAVNCAALPDSLLESELFGHERGAFTGAARSRRGYFELAHRGTIFLDEIADMSPPLQAKLLRALQERKIQRLGAEQQITVDVRVMAATNRDLEEGMGSGSFRRDLYYRLATVALLIPPLRDRREDIESLAHSYREQFANQLGRPVEDIQPEALAALRGYAWPGNVRELINVMERAVLLAGGREITPADLPQPLQLSAPEDAGPRASEVTVRLSEAALERPLRDLRAEAVAVLERAYLVRQLERARGRVGRTAALAGIGPRALHTKLKRYGLRKESFKGGADQRRS